MIDPLAPPPARRMPILEVARAAADAYEVNPAEVLGKSKRRAVIGPRFMAVYLAREKIGATFEAIGSAFNRDHTSILNAHRRMSAAIAQNPQLGRVAETIWERANGR